ncbi:MAG TPA: RDD family protein [Firmicutes bacterium]|nr:RDD family protein [Bacillota bacterium]
MFSLLLKRSFAFLIDAIILTIIFYGNAVFVMVSMYDTIIGVESVSITTYVFMIMLQLFYVCIYFIYLPIRMNGQTLGKKVFKIKEVTQGEGELIVSDYFKRDVLLKFLLMTMTGGLVLVLNVILFSYQLVKKQELKALHDIIMKTKVMSFK